MIHTTLYHGRYDINFERLHDLRKVSGQAHLISETWPL